MATMTAAERWFPPCTSVYPVVKALSKPKKQGM